MAIKKNKLCGIYKITSPTNKIYIGQSIDIEYRWYTHKKYLGKDQRRLCNSFKSHGVENHSFEILEECSQELLNEREIHWIKHFDSFDTSHGLNLRSGGDQGLHSDESRKTMSEAAKKKAPATEEARKNMSKPRTEEHRRNISLGLIGNKNNCSVKRGPNSEEHRNKISKKLAGIPKSEKTKKKISDKLKGVKHSEERNENNRKSKIGNKYRLGQKLSPESIAKREATKAKNRALKEQLKQHTIQSIVFRQHYFKTFVQEK